MILCLDLSSKCTGYAKFTEDGKLKKKGRIIPDKNIDNYWKIHYNVIEIQKLFKGVEQLVIEDLFIGINPKSILYLARLSGAVIYAWLCYKYKLPRLYTASRARKIVGINGRAQKAEVQLWVLGHYKYAPEEFLEQYNDIIEELKAQYKNKDIKKTKFKYQMGKISKEIEDQTGIGEDVADAIVLGLAYTKENNNE